MSPPAPSLAELVRETAPRHAILNVPAVGSPRDPITLSDDDDAWVVIDSDEEQAGASSGPPPPQATSCFSADEALARRLQREEAISTTRPAGKHVISTGIAGAETLEVDLKPGHAHYVRIDLRERTHNLHVSLVEVEEQVAEVERPELAQAI